MDTHITTAPDIDDRIGAPLGSPIRLPGGRGTLPHLEEHEPGSLGESVGGAEAEEASTGEPREKLVASTQRSGRRTSLLSTAAVVVVLAGIGGVAWAERQGTVSLPLPPKMIALLRTGLPSTTQVTGEVGVTPARPQVTPPASSRANPEIAALAARQQVEFASLKFGDTVAEVGVPPINRPAPQPISTAQPPAVAASVATPATTAEVGAPANPAVTQTVAPVTPPAPPSPSNTAPTPAPVAATASPTVAASAVTAPRPACGQSHPCACTKAPRSRADRGRATCRTRVTQAAGRGCRVGSGAGRPAEGKPHDDRPAADDGCGAEGATRHPHDGVRRPAGTGGSRNRAGAIGPRPPCRSLAWR